MNGMNDGNYGGGGPPDAETMEDSEDSEVGAKSALLPTSLLPPNPKVGDTFTIKIEAIFSDEAEVSVVSESETETPETLTADQEIETAAMVGE
mgnify:CR=1 FL=1